MPDPLATVRRRLREQRLTGPPAATPADVVRWLGAVQAQELAEAKWSLAERCDGTDDAVEASCARGEILRTHVLRPTWHFVAREDVRRLLRLTRPRVHALNRFMYGKLGLDADVLARGQAELARALADGEALTRRELAGRLAAAGLPAAGLALGYVLMHAELEEVICSGPRRGRQHTYVLLDDRVPAGGPELPRERALAELAQRYFASHGPATVRDFAGWASLTRADARTGIAGAALECAEDTGATAWYAAREPLPRRAAPPRAFLVPMYDETVVAYRDLKVVLAREPPRAGLLERPIVLDGRTVGSWRRTLTARAATVEATLFGPLEPDGEAALEAAVARFGRFLGVSADLRAQVAR